MVSLQAHAPWEIVRDIDDKKVLIEDVHAVSPNIAHFQLKYVLKTVKGWYGNICLLYIPKYE